MSTSADPLRVACFVEGSLTSGDDRDPLLSLWRKALPGALGLRAIEHMVPISKHHLVAMDRENRHLPTPTSTVSVSLDEILAKELKTRPFDTAVVAWDLGDGWGR